MPVNSHAEVIRFLKNCNSNRSSFDPVDRCKALLDMIDGYTCHEIRGRHSGLAEASENNFAYWWEQNVGARRSRGCLRLDYYEDQEAYAAALVVRSFLCDAYQRLTGKAYPPHTLVHVPHVPRAKFGDPDYVPYDIDLKTIKQPKHSPAGGRRITDKNGILSVDSVTRIEALLQEFGSDEEGIIKISKITGTRRFVITAIMEGQYDPHELPYVAGVKPVACIKIRNFEHLVSTSRPTTDSSRRPARLCRILTPRGVRGIAEEKRIRDTFTQHHNDPYLQEMQQREAARRGLFTI